MTAVIHLLPQCASYRFRAVSYHTCGMSARSKRVLFQRLSRRCVCPSQVTAMGQHAINYFAQECSTNQLSGSPMRSYDWYFGTPNRRITPVYICLCVCGGVVRACVLMCLSVSVCVCVSGIESTTHYTARFFFITLQLCFLFNKYSIHFVIYIRVLWFADFQYSTEINQSFRNAKHYLCISFWCTYWYTHISPETSSCRHLNL